jgi:peroxiredoxin
MKLVALLKSIGTLKTGSEAPGFSLLGVDGKMHALPDYRENRALLVIFMCNHCPYVKAKMTSSAG